MKKTKASLWMIGITFLTAGFVLLWPYSAKETVMTARVETGEFFQTLLMSGSVCYEEEQPIVNLVDGKIRQVYVAPGEPVKKGQLLISIDTEAEEEMLSYVIRMRMQQESMYEEDSMAAMAVQGISNLLEKEAELRRRIEAAQIRAPLDGRVEQVYVQAGTYAQKEQLLGSIHGDELWVTAAVDADKLRQVGAGAFAVVKKNGTAAGTAVLHSLNAPVMNEAKGALMQQAVFTLLDKQQIHAGDRVTLEVVRNRKASAALVPVAAVSRSNEVWIVDNGVVSPVVLDVNLHNDTWVAADTEMAGKSVVLLPDQYELTTGCKVNAAEVP